MLVYASDKITYNVLFGFQTFTHDSDLGAAPLTLHALPFRETQLLCPHPKLDKFHIFTQVAIYINDNYLLLCKKGAHVLAYAWNVKWLRLFSFWKGDSCVEVKHLPSHASHLWIWAALANIVLSWTACPIPEGEALEPMQPEAWVLSIEPPPHAPHLLERLGLCTEPILWLFRWLWTGLVWFGYRIIALYTNHKNMGVTIPYCTQSSHWGTANHAATVQHHVISPEFQRSIAHAQLMASLLHLHAYL